MNDSMQVVFLESTKHVLGAISVNNETTPTRTREDLVFGTFPLPHQKEFIEFSIILDKLSVESVTPNSSVIADPLAFAVVGAGQTLDSLREVSFPAAPSVNSLAFSIKVDPFIPVDTSGVCFVLRENDRTDDRFATLSVVQAANKKEAQGDFKNSLKTTPTNTDRYLGVVFIQGFRPHFFILS